MIGGERDSHRLQPFSSSTASHTKIRKVRYGEIVIRKRRERERLKGIAWERIREGDVRGKKRGRDWREHLDEDYRLQTMSGDESEEGRSTASSLYEYDDTPITGEGSRISDERLNGSLVTIPIAAFSLYKRPSSSHLPDPFQSFSAHREAQRQELLGRGEREISNGRFIRVSFRLTA